MRWFFFTVLICVVGMGCDSASPDPVVPQFASPEQAQIVTADVTRFWAAYDEAYASDRTFLERAAIFERAYLNLGTPALDDLVDVRLDNATRLVSAIDRYPAYYAGTRPGMDLIVGPATEAAIRALYRELDGRYDEALFPDVSFVVGDMTKGGFVSRNGLIIGTELFARTAATPVDELGTWHRAVTRFADDVLFIVAHELVHAQQLALRTSSSRTLLAQAIIEGSADYVGELLAGGHVNEHVHVYGDAHEADLWAAFAGAMNGTDWSAWLYNGAQATEERPADLGYYIGYQITAAYFERVGNPDEALRDLFEATDFTAFLEASGYAAQFDS
ncbi:MAG: DUF2268 domain-containing putative Zn-dependent protease [Bacteroidota bacterium]